jgi:hypothetical protein
MTPRRKQTGDAGHVATASASPARAGSRHGQHFIILSDALQAWTPMIDAGNNMKNTITPALLSGIVKYFSKTG